MLTLDPLNIVALFAAMATLAALPSISVLAVTSRAVTSGFNAGAAVGLGVVVGDIVFILIAVLGLAVLAEVLGPWFFAVRMLGGLYLVWLGVRLWRSALTTDSSVYTKRGSLASDFSTGLVITLGDQKAILFYLGFFPAFLDLAAMRTADVIAVALVAFFSVGGTKLFYAWAAARAGHLLNAHKLLMVGRIGAVVLVVTGLGVMAGSSLPEQYFR